MTHIYHRIFDQFRIVDSRNVSRSDIFAAAAQWLDAPGCVFQRNNFVLDSEIRTEGIDHSADGDGRMIFRTTRSGQKLATAAMCGLVADGVWDAASALCLAIPATIFWTCVAWSKLGKRSN